MRRVAGKVVATLILSVALPVIGAHAAAEPAPRRTPDPPDPGGAVEGVSQDLVDAFGQRLLRVLDDGTLAPLPLPAPPGLPATGGAAPARAASLLNGRVVYPLSHGAGPVAVGDVTGDGRADVVAGEAGVDSLYVLAQTPSGTLAAPVAYPVRFANQGTFDGTVAIADMNSDGRQDVVVSLENAVGVMLQRADGTLAPPVTASTVHRSFSNVFKLQTGDFNHDGRTDIASIDWGTQSQAVDVFLGKPGGALELPAVYAAPHGGYDDVETGDVNADGLDDLVVMSGQSYAYDNFSVLVQNAQGTFSAPASYDLGWNENSRSIGVGDVTGDGRKDVALAFGGNGAGARLAIFPQLATGKLGAPTFYPSLDIPGTVVIADLNQDGRSDVLLLHNGWLAAGVYLQTGAGTLAPEVTFGLAYASWYNVHGMAVGDVNGGGKPDVVIGNSNYGVEILYGESPVIAHAGRDTTVECAAAGGLGTAVQLDGSLSEGDGIAFRWFAPGVSFDDSTAVRPTGYFPPGLTSVVLEVSLGAIASRDTVLVNVQDTAPPTLSLAVTPAMLWPPNNQLLPVHVAALATDACDAAPAIRLVSVASSDGETGSTGPHGEDIDDATLGEADFDVQLRAERSGDGTGRTYTLTYEAIDAAGHSVRQSVVVAVPHSMGRAALWLDAVPRLTIFGAPQSPVSRIEPASILVGTWEEDRWRAAPAEAMEADVDGDGLLDHTWALEVIAASRPLAATSSLEARWQTAGEACSALLAVQAATVVESRPADFFIRPASQPSAGHTRLVFGLPTSGTARLCIFDLAGRVLATPVNGVLPAGRHEAELDFGPAVRSQVVFYQLEWNGRRIGGRMVLIH